MKKERILFKTNIIKQMLKVWMISSMTNYGYKLSDGFIRECKNGKFCVELFKDSELLDILDTTLASNVFHCPSFPILPKNFIITNLEEECIEEFEKCKEEFEKRKEILEKRIEELKERKEALEMLEQEYEQELEEHEEEFEKSKKSKEEFEKRIEELKNREQEA